ncbi:MAG: ABC transporter ATP-binding protein [Planctomycetes bacterium]|nr:ABC transporter ATP-binding protein [Planctomycetota bacterium]
MRKLLERWFQGLATSRRFMPELEEQRGELLWVALCSLFLVAFDVLRPIPFQLIIDSALNWSPNWPPATSAGAPREAPFLVRSGYTAAQVIWIGAVAALSTALLSALFQYLREIGMAGIQHQVTRRIRFRMFSHLTQLSPLFHARHKSGDLLVRLMGDAPMVTTMMVESTIEIGTRVLVALGTIGMMLHYDPVLTATMLAAIPFLAVAMVWTSGQIKTATRKARQKEGDMADYLHEAISATETIQSLGGSAHVVRSFAKSNRRSARAGLKSARLAARLSASVETILGVSTAGVIAFGSFRVAQGHLGLGELVAFVSYVRNLLKPVRTFSKHTEKISKGAACAERLVDVLDQEPDVQDAPGAVEASPDPRELVYERVSFSYKGGVRALDGFDVRFQRGQLSAMVGRNGAGKSTAAALALRLFDPGEGRVLLDGQALTTLQLTSLRARVGLCLQTTFLFGDSIRENLLIGKPDASEEELWAALKLADADELVRGLEGGLDSKLGSSGAGLSGGQKHRISLARTLLRKPAVLIVDEPFAGLDKDAAHKVARTLEELARERIVIVIAHDILALEVYDRIVFLEAGRVVAEGRHADLLAREPLYRQVVRHAGVGA